MRVVSFLRLCGHVHPVHVPSMGAADNTGTVTAIVTRDCELMRLIEKMLAHTFPQRSRHQIEISIYEDRGSSGSSSGSSSVSGSTAR